MVWSRTIPVSAMARVALLVSSPAVARTDSAERAEKGETFSGMTRSEAVMEPGGQYYRFMKAIAVQPQCLLCHGPSDQIPDRIKAVLKKQYLFDAATGYKAGELRGAVSIKQPIGQTNE